MDYKACTEPCFFDRLSPFGLVAVGIAASLCLSTSSKRTEERAKYEEKGKKEDCLSLSSKKPSSLCFSNRPFSVCLLASRSRLPYYQSIPSSV